MSTRIRTSCRNLLLLGLALLAGCEGGRSDIEQINVVGGDPAQGAQIIKTIGCGACHVIPGIDNAEGLVGPPLTSWSNRSYIAGKVPNRPENLVTWIMDAHLIEPGTAMPDLELNEHQARDVAAYLYTLE